MVERIKEIWEKLIEIIEKIVKIALLCSVVYLAYNTLEEEPEL
jgi:hypothetical protein